MNHWMWAISLAGILSTAVVWGTDMFFLTIGRPALRLATISAATEVMGFFHLFGDARMPIWGISAILSNILLVVFSRTGQRWFYAISVLMLLLFVTAYNRLSKPIIGFKPKRQKPDEASTMAESSRPHGTDPYSFVFRCSLSPCSPSASR